MLKFAGTPLRQRGKLRAFILQRQTKWYPQIRCCECPFLLYVMQSCLLPPHVSVGIITWIATDTSKRFFRRIDTARPAVGTQYWRGLPWLAVEHEGVVHRSQIRSQRFCSVRRTRSPTACRNSSFPDRGQTVESQQSAAGQPWAYTPAEGYWIEWRIRGYGRNHKSCY